MRKIVLCENCESVMRPAKTKSEKRKVIQEKLNSHLDISRGQKKPEFLLEVWKCNCPKQTYIIYLLE